MTFSDTADGNIATLIAALAARHWTTFRWAGDPGDPDFYVVFFDLGEDVPVHWLINIEDFHEFNPLATGDNRIELQPDWQFSPGSYVTLRQHTSAIMRPLIPREDITP